MDELRRAADLLVADPPVAAATLEELARRNDRRRNRRRAIAGVLAVVALTAGSVVVASRRSSDDARVVTEPQTSGGRLAVATGDGVDLIDEHAGVVAELDLGFAPIMLSWSPNGHWLAVGGEHEAVLVRRDGERREPVPADRGELSWLAEETLVLDGSREMEPGGAVRRIGSEAGMRSGDGALLAHSDAPARTITISAPDGTDPRTYGPLPGIDDGVGLIGFSPDNRWLLYLAFATRSSSLAQDGVPLHALRIADGRTFEIGITLGYEQWVRWSPDGRTLLVVAGEGRFLYQRKTLRSCDLTAPACVDLPTPSDLSAFDPAWSPDGAQIAFVGAPTEPSSGSAPGHLWYLRTDTRVAAASDLAPPGVLLPMWTADGRTVVVLQVDAGTGEVRVRREGPSTSDLLATIAVPPASLQGYLGRFAPPTAWSPASR